MMEVEICVDSVESAVAAAAGRANRIELCSALSEGGITPSIGLVRAVRAAVNIDVFVILRPRGGDFVYSDAEFAVMRDDLLQFKASGVNGVVIGLLTREAKVDVERTTFLVNLARPMQVTFHRAFDTCADLDSALQDVIATGADRLLTAGGKLHAVEGADTLAQLNRTAGDRIRIMAGGGIRASNVQQVVNRTGVRAVHSSVSSKDGAEKPSHCSEVASLFGGSSRRIVNERDVRALKTALDSILV